MNTVGDRIKDLRKKEGLNQLDFCKKINLSQGRLSEIEKGKNNPSYETLVSIKNIFNVSLDWLVSGEYPKSDNIISNDQSRIINTEKDQVPNSSLHKHISVTTDNQDANVFIEKYDSAYIDHGSDELSLDSISDNEKRFIGLLRQLDQLERAKIEGMLELKIAESKMAITDKKITSSFYQSGKKDINNEDENAATVQKLA